MSDNRFDPGSFRDRDARVFLRDGVVYRALSATALEEWRTLVSTRFFGELTRERKVVSTEEVEASTAGAGWAGALRHERVPFRSYPYEWSFSMLRDAALLQLDVLARALNEDVTLKDASAYNVQWFGARPVFVDIASFERWREGEPWVAYRQFCRHFLNPLLLQAYKGVHFQPWLRGDLEGIPADQLSALMSPRDLLRRGVLLHVKAAAAAERRYEHANATKSVRSELRAAGFGKELIRANVRGLQKLVASLRWTPPRSEWSDYGVDNVYEKGELARKEETVRTIVAARRRALVWDLGCNHGRFARIAAENSDYVVAVDADHLTIDRLYVELARAGEEKVHPLVMNLANMSPAQGWLGAERLRFESRGTPDLILALALVHHLVLSANVPLPEVVAAFARFGGELLLEFVERGDPMIDRLLRDKVDNFADYNRSNFERLLEERYEIAQRVEVRSPSRTLYHCRPRA